MRHNNLTKCYRPGCANPRAGECGFCHECKAAMRTPASKPNRSEQLVYDACVCGAAAERDYLCEPCDARERPRMWR